MPDPIITASDTAKTAVLQAFETIAQLCKSVLDHDPGRHDELEMFLGLFNDYLQDWNPGSLFPQRRDLEITQERAGEQPPEFVQRVSANEAQIALYNELIDRRDLHRLGLLFWTFRNIRDGAAGDWLGAWKVLANYFTDVTRLAELLDKSIKADFENQARWSNWILETLPSGQAHAIGVDHDLIQTFLTRALQLIVADHQAATPKIEPMEWTRGRLDNPLDEINNIIAQERLAPLMPEDAKARAAKLAAVLDTANRERDDRDDQRIIDAPLSQERLAAFEDQLRETWQGTSWLYAAAQAAGAVEQIDAPMPDAGSGSQINTWLPKSILINDPRVYGADHIAHQYGVGLANHETETIIAAIESTAVVADAAPEASITEALRSVIDAMRDAGFVPNIVIVPPSWRLRQELGIEGWNTRGGPADPPTWVSEGMQSFVPGIFDGIPIGDGRHIADLSLYVVDIHRFMRIQEWAPGGEGLTVRFDPFDEVAAEQLARQQPTLFEGEGNFVNRVRAVRMHIRLLARVGYEIETHEPKAARRIAVPPGLRG